MKKTEIAQAFSQGNFEKCLNYVTEETIWNTPGEHYLHGNKEIENFCKKISGCFYRISTNFDQLNLIENSTCVAINGTAEFLRDGKRVSFVSSCDVYVFDNKNKIVSIHSNCITEKQNLNYKNEPLAKYLCNGRVKTLGSGNGRNSSNRPWVTTSRLHR